MTINLTMPETYELKPRITVIGVGGAGGNAVNNMIDANLEGVEFLVVNTDAQSLAHSKAGRKLQMGTGITQGLGAGSRPEIGRAAAEEALQEILDHLEGSNMVFITAGLGGGTGTGGAPVIARAAREKGILTVGVVTKPFAFEGTQRMRLAEMGMAELQQYVDTLIVIPNQNLFRVANETTTFADAFKMADNVLQSGVRGVTDLMVMPGLINLDFADIRTVMGEMGKAMMGTGEADGDQRGLNAAEAAIANPLLDDVTMKGARGVLINITGGLDMTLFEVDEAANRIREEVDPEANIIFGSTFDQALEGRMRVSVVATGIDLKAELAPKPTRISLVAEGGRAIQPGKSVAGPAATAEAGEPTLGTAPQPGGQRPAGEIPAASAEPAAAPMDPPFIAPEPMAPTPKRAEPDPFAAAALANGPQRRETTTERPSLFERMTGTGRAARPRETAETQPTRPITRPTPPMAAPARPAAPAAPPAAPAAAPVAPERAAAPVVPAAPERAAPTAPERPAAPAIEETRPAAPVQGRLDEGIASEAAPTEETAGQEEDLLEIPAFLRRQAN
ncbi:MAG: cell division protein FtsZ [Alphaproteobacteria bacterium]|nr:cell division protein FtsZ [Alphaproteobacteria bacterium]